MTARVGLLGGTFDPIHEGHLRAAAAVRDAFGLDRVVLIPSNVPPHRPSQPRASGFHRFAMTAMAAMSCEGLEASDVELAASGPSYTVTTLSRFHDAGVGPSQLFFAIGVDAFAEIATWRHYPALLDAAHFVVVSRPGHDHDAALARVPELRSRVVDARGGLRVSSIPPLPSVFLLDADTPDVSSTLVRRRLAEGRSLDGLVPACVGGHIARHHLYQPPPGGSPLA
jgi:nicotinate-nucleotide adenylyltransferase